MDTVTVVRESDIDAVLRTIDAAVRASNTAAVVRESDTATVVRASNTATVVRESNTAIEFMRKGSKGLEGTYENAHHHAQMMLPILDYMAPKVPFWGFKIWRQGHNMHMLMAKDGRRFTLRPVQLDTYVGIKVHAHLSRGYEFPLCTALLDSPASWRRFDALMRTLGGDHEFGREKPVVSKEINL